MTLIVGIQCEDGIALAADSAATFVADRPTIRQQTSKKLKIIDDGVVLGVSGPVGLGQQFQEAIKKMWDEKTFSRNGSHGTPGTAMAIVRRRLWELIEPEFVVARSAQTLLQGRAHGPALSRSILTIPIGRKDCLFQFDEQGAPEQATSELPFVAVGSGQAIAEPFLAFIRRVFWENKSPSLAQGTFAAIWTLSHVIDINPGGVAAPIQTVTIKDSKTKEFQDGDLAEHFQMIENIEKHIASFGSSDISVSEPPSIPPK